MKILVTGATGFVGSVLVPALRGQGHSVIRTVRTASEASDLEVPDIRAGLSTEALSGMDVVIHLAGIAHRRAGSADDYREINHEAAVLTAKQAAAAGVDHFIFFSTSKVYGDYGNQPFTKDSPLNPPDAYSDSKAQAEQAIMQLGAEMSVSVVRPPVIYGPGASGNIGLLIRAISRGIPIPVPVTPNSRSILYIDNLRGAVAALLGVRGAGATVFQPADAEPVSFQRIAETVGLALGRKARFITAPASALNLMQLPFRLLGQQPLDPIFRDFELALDTELIDLGWKNRHVLPIDGLTKTVRCTIGSDSLA